MTPPTPPLLLSSTTTTTVDPFALHWSLYPKHYVAPKTLTGIQTLDGKILDKPEWQSIPFSSYFDEIRGVEDAPPNTRPCDYGNYCSTKMKMMWDDEYLYIGALIESSGSTIMPVIANYTKHNSPIFQSDSDFEVFVNPSSSCHNYKELELNAINTVWNLLLDKPYDDNGHEHSGRVAKPGEDDYYEVYKQQTATHIYQGKINDNSLNNVHIIWGIEIALSHSDTLVKDILLTKYHKKYPIIGDLWRINFSRVEKQGDINWTWQSQRIWDTQHKRVMGKVAMHLPDAWGYIEFGPSIPSSSSENNNDVIVGEISSLSIEQQQKHRDPVWPAKLAVMNIYYAQRRYYELHDKERYAFHLGELENLVDPNILKPFVSQINIVLSKDGKKYTASVIMNNSKVNVTEERLLTIENKCEMDDK